MKRPVKILLTLMLCAVLAGTVLIAGCSEKSPYIVSIEQVGSQLRAEYSDGTYKYLTIENNTDSVTADDLYERYKEEYGEISYSDFLNEYIAYNADSASVIGECLLSSAKIYTEFVKTTTSMGWGGIRQVSDTAVNTGSAIIWDIDGIEEGYTYFVTNYHVVYYSSADSAKNGGTKLARKYTVYLYGSESTPVADGETDEGYTAYNYGTYGIECEYVGGSVICDLAVVKAKTEAVKAVNENIQAVKLAEGYCVGETAIAIGNPENEGISVTKGIVSVANESIALNIDGTARAYRSLRIDTALYSGNSGGGLFNSDGKLIGITNAGDNTDQNINFAIPVEIVKGAVNNIIYYHTDGDENTVDGYVVKLGVNIESANSKYVFENGSGSIVEDVIVNSVNDNSIAYSLGIEEGDVITAVCVNGVRNIIKMLHDITDILYDVRSGDSITVEYVRNGENKLTGAYTVANSDLQAM